MSESEFFLIIKCPRCNNEHRGDVVRLRVLYQEWRFKFPGKPFFVCCLNCARPIEISKKDRAYKKIFKSSGLFDPMGLPSWVCKKIETTLNSKGDNNG